MSLLQAPRTLRGSRIPIQVDNAGQPTLMPLTRPTAAVALSSASSHDTLGRPLTDLRISVTDRCNFRCGYCMPRASFGTDHAFLPQSALLRFEEIERAARAMVRLGVRKIRLTGGEPLLRKDLPALVAQLAALRTPDGQAVTLALTTNGTLLARQARALREAGLQRVTVSLDALDNDLLRQMSDADVSVHDVLAGIDAAQAAGLGPIKVNMVVQRGVNEHQIVPMARHFRGRQVTVRFIEYMDVGHTNQWQLDQVVPSAAVIQQLQQAFDLRPVQDRQAGDTAARWAHADGSGEVGTISSVTQAFCGDCTRLRLSTDGRLFTCLFASQGHDLRTALRDATPWSDDELVQGVAAIWRQRRDRYSQLRHAAAGSAPPPAKPDHPATPRRIEMSYIGG